VCLLGSGVCTAKGMLAAEVSFLIRGMQPRGGEKGTWGGGVLLSITAKAMLAAEVRGCRWQRLSKLGVGLGGGALPRGVGEGEEGGRGPGPGDGKRRAVSVRCVYMWIECTFGCASCPAACDGLTCDAFVCPWSALLTSGSCAPTRL
jgi:hypothetical protein